MVRRINGVPSNRVTLQEDFVMMMFTNFKPSSVPNPFLDTWTGIADVYRNAMETSAQQWVTSSANIIQQHTMQAFVNASQACADALAKNALAMQQKSMEHLVDANQKAVGLVGKAVTDAWMGGMRAKR
jgi:hypothetical protein